MTTAKTKRPSRSKYPTMPLIVEEMIGEVTFDGRGDDTPVVAAMRQIDEHAMAREVDTTYKFELPDGGPRFTFSVEH